MKKNFMRRAAADAEVIYLLDEFLWEEELIELSVARRCLASLSTVVGSSGEHVLFDWIMNALPTSSDRTDSFTLLMALHCVSIGELDGSRHVMEAVQGMGLKRFGTDKHRSLLLKVSSQLSGLISFLVSNQIGLVRDTSRMSLLRQVSTVSSTSSQFEPSILSTKIRICLNILYLTVIVNQHEDWLQETIEQAKLHENMISLLRLHSDNLVPVRKIVLFIFKLLSLFGSDSDIHLPSNTPGLCEASTASPLSTLLGFVPLLSVPKLSDFRAFVALTIHTGNLMDWTGPDGVRPRPAAIEEGIALCEEHMRGFIESYRFHEAEIELLRTDPSLLPAFKLYLELERQGKLGRVRTNLLRPPGKMRERFSLPELAKHMISNYQISCPSNFSIDSSSEESESEIPNLPLVHEAYQSCHSWLAVPSGREDALIEAIAEAAVPAPFLPAALLPDDPEPVRKNLDVYTPQILQEMLVILLKLLLSSCRGAMDPILSPTNHPSFDLDRDHLLAVLERFEIGTPPTTPRESSMRVNFEIISCAVTGILVLLLKLHEKESDLIQRTIVANNGCLVLLKLITSYPNEPNSNSYTCIFPELRDNKSWNLAVPARLPTSLFRSLKCLYILCRSNVPRIKKYLIHYKVAVVLKRFFAIPNVGILKIAYKLFKIQMRFLPKKWKILHIKLLSCCYNATDLDLLDDWIVNDPELGPADGPTEDLLNDSHIPQASPVVPTLDEGEYAEALRRVNFDKRDEIEVFCKKYGENPETFFGSKSIKTYQDWFLLTLGTRE